MLIEAKEEYEKIGKFLTIYVHQLLQNHKFVDPTLPKEINTNEQLEMLNIIYKFCRDYFQKTLSIDMCSSLVFPIKIILFLKMKQTHFKGKYSSCLWIYVEKSTSGES